MLTTSFVTAKRLCTLLATVVLVGCGGGGGASPSVASDVGTSVSGAIVSGVKVVDSSELAPATVSVGAGNGSLTVSGAVGGTLGTVTDGQVVMLPADESKGLPLGFTGKAEKQVDGSVKLVQAQMGDVFKRLQVDFDSQRDGGVVAGVMAHGSAKADFYTGYPKTLQGGLDYVSCKVTAALKVEGEIKCSNGALNGTVSINHPVKVKKKGSSEEAMAYLYAEVSVHDLVQTAVIDFDVDKYPKTGGVRELTSKISGRWDYKMGIKIDEGDLTGSEATLYEIPSWSELIRKDGNNIWDENTKVKFGKYFELSGLNGDDKKGLIPLAGIYFTPANISTGGMPFTGDLSAAQLGQIKALGVVVWVYIDVSGNITLRGEANLLEVKGPQVEKGFSIKRNGDELQSETINTGGEAEVLAPSINGSVEMTQNLGVPMVLDVLALGTRPASVRVDLLAFQASGKLAGKGGYRWNPQPRGLVGEVCLSNNNKLYSQFDFRAAINAKLDAGWLELEGGKEFQKAFDHEWWGQFNGMCANNYTLTLTNESTVPDPTTAGHAVVDLAFLDGVNNPAMSAIVGEWRIQEEGPRGSKTWTADAAQNGHFSLSLPTGRYTFTATALHKDFNDRDGNPLVVTRSAALEVDVTPAQAVASASSANVAQAVEFWIKNAWSTIQTVVWNFAGTVVEQTVNLVGGESTKISHMFSSEGTKTVTATYKDVNGNVLGEKTVQLEVIATPVQYTTAITDILDDSVSPAQLILEVDSRTSDSTPLIKGTISAELGSCGAVSRCYGVQVFENGEYLATAAVSGKQWTLSAPVLQTGFHVLIAAVVRFDGIEGAHSAQRTLAIVPVQTTASKLPHSGVTASQCYQVGSNTLVACDSAGAIALGGAGKQDGMLVSTNAMSYSKVGFNGEQLPDSASSWCAVKDNVTGLLWQNHQSTPGAYTNWDGNGAASQYAASNATLCGLAGWRLPSIDELETLVDASKPWPGPTINTTWFQNTPGRGYWSSSPFAGGSGFTWAVTFNHGNLYGLTYSGGSLYVRLVRGVNEFKTTCPSAPTADRFSIVDSEVTDKRTGLVWARCSVGQSWNGSTCAGTASSFTHEAALQYAANQSGWRLPSRRELFSLADKSCISPSIDRAAFPSTVSAWYWSSTPYVGNSGYAWDVSFDHGSVGNATFGGGDRNDGPRIRLVRMKGGQ